MSDDTGDTPLPDFDRLARRWHGMARSSGTAVADVDDLVQEVAARVLRHHLGQPFATEDDAARWGATVLANLARDRHRRSRRHPVVSYQELAESALRPAPGVDGVVEERECARAVADAVAGLATGDQEVIRARYHDGLSYRAAAAQLGICESAYGVRLHRAMRNLRARLVYVLGEHRIVPLLAWRVRRGVRWVDPALMTQAVATALAVALTSNVPTVAASNRVRAVGAVHSVGGPSVRAGADGPLPRPRRVAAKVRTSALLTTGDPFGRPELSRREVGVRDPITSRELTIVGHQPSTHRILRRCPDVPPVVKCDPTPTPSPRR